MAETSRRNFLGEGFECGGKSGTRKRSEESRKAVLYLFGTSFSVIKIFNLILKRMYGEFLFTIVIFSSRKVIKLFFKTDLQIVKLFRKKIYKL